MAEFSQFRDINGRLKKRFNLLRKPNLREASDSFRRLSTEVKDFADYSGYCLFSAAKCEHQIVGALREQASQPSKPSQAIPARSATANRALENLLDSAT